MGGNRKLWLKADLPESMSASCCASCDRSVRGSCDSGISNCVRCDVSCSEAVAEKSFVGGDVYVVRCDGVGARLWCCRFRGWPGSGHCGINRTINRPL